MWNCNVLIKVTASIAAYKIATVVSQLRQQGYNIQVIGTPDAKHFVGASTWEGLSGLPYKEDIYAPGQAHDHIYLNRWADLILLAPATANTLNKMAVGLGDNLVTSLFLAHDFSKPYLVAPAMNEKMYHHPATKQAIAQLKKWGLKFIDPQYGTLACGEEGQGKLAEPEQILNAIAHHLHQISKQEEDKREKRVLVTSGGTQEAIDDVRFITNHSTGKTGALLAEHLYRSGYHVTYVHAPTAKQPNLPCKKIPFTNFFSLKTVLQNELSVYHYDLIIHAAAVSDYSVKSTFKGKLTSTQNCDLQLIANEKIIDHLKSYSLNPHVRLIAFKLTSTSDENKRLQAVQELFSHSPADAIVHNDFNEISSGQHSFTFYKRNSDLFSTSLPTPFDLAKEIQKFDEVSL